MATIASLAREHDMQPYEVQDFADLNHLGQTAELTDATEAWLRDLLDNTTDGRYTGAGTLTPGPDADPS